MDTVDIHLIGGALAGESVILHIPAANYALVIDTCKEGLSSQNLTLNKLDQLRIGSFDLVWSHPDKDHYLGIEDLLNSSKIRCLYMFPGYEWKKTLKYYLGMDVNTQLQRVLDVLDKKVLENEITLKYLTSESQHRIKFNQYEFFLSTFAPSPQLAHQNQIKQMQAFRSATSIPEAQQPSTIHSNDYSLGFVFEFNGRRICLCGDVEDKTLSLIDEENMESIFSNLDYIKVPHHGSKTTQLHFSAMKNLGTAGVTRFKDSAPDAEILRRYKSITEEVYGTSKIGSSSSVGGVVHTRIPLKGVQTTTLYGDAYMC